MVIQHNLMAMDAQRQFNISGTNKKKSTEKLSSGYRINRSADDAAGLSISEKMRRQIRGLEQGARNTQDGISLIQVADGALSEVHDMLHRVTELSVQAANDTNTKEDREAIQREITQIMSEVDRISDCTEFNTRKIFKNEPVGKKEVQQPTSGNEINNETAFFGISNISCSGIPNNDSITEYTFGGNANGLLINGSQVPWSSIKATNGNTIDCGRANTYACNYNGIKFSFDLKSGSTIEDILESIQNAKVNISVKNQVEKKVVSMYGRGMVAVDDYNSMSRYQYFSYVGDNLLSANDTGLTWNGQTISWTKKADNGKSYLDIMRTAVELENSQTMSFSFVNGPSFQLSVHGLNASSYEDLFDKVKRQLNGATLDIRDTGEVKSSGGQMVLQAKDYNIDTRLKTDDMWSDLGYNLNIVYGETLNTSLIIDPANVENTVLRVSGNGKTVDYGLNAESKNVLKNIMNDQGGVVLKDQSFNMVFPTGIQKVTCNISIKNDTSLMNVLGQMQNIFSDYSYQTKSFTILSVEDITPNIPAATTAYSYSYIQPTLREREIGDDNIEDTEDDISENEEGTLQLWIQSGADAGDGMFIEVDNMNTSILGIKDVSVLTYEDASNAISTVSKAVDRVSAMRSKLGAQQNRLEHTYNNVLNNAENTQAAESRIRDTDMSKEMVEYSKSNILEQVGMSVIAQANQNNNGVINLLQ